MKKVCFWSVKDGKKTYRGFTINGKNKTFLVSSTNSLNKVISALNKIGGKYTKPETLAQVVKNKVRR